jgi:hypothetical protein
MSEKGVVPLVTPLLSAGVADIVTPLVTPDPPTEMV